MAKKESSFMVIATLYEAPKHNDEFKKEFKMVTKAAKAVNRNYAEDFNERAEQSGKWYEFDEDATKEFYANRKMAQIDREKAEEAEKQVGKALLSAVVSTKTSKK